MLKKITDLWPDLLRRNTGREERAAEQEQPREDHGSQQTMRMVTQRKSLCSQGTNLRRSSQMDSPSTLRRSSRPSSASSGRD